MLSEFELAFTFIKNVCIKVGIYIYLVRLLRHLPACTVCTQLNHTMLWNILNSLPLTKGFQKFLLRQCFKVPTYIMIEVQWI